MQCLELLFGVILSFQEFQFLRVSRLGGAGRAESSARRSAAFLKMAYTPSTTAFGELGEFWAGSILGNGLQVTPQDIYWVAYNHGKVSEGDMAPFLILNTYTPELEEEWVSTDRHHPVHDGVWLANSRMIDECRVKVANRGIRRALDADLVDEDDYVLCINWWQTIALGQVAGAVEYTFPHTHQTAGGYGIHIVGVVIMSGSHIVEYLPGLHEWSALHAALPQHLKDRLPDMPSVPFFSAFQTSTAPAVLPHVDHQLVLTGDVKLHAGCEDGLLRAIEYKAEDGSLRYAWLQSCDVVDGKVGAFHIHDPTTLALTNETVKNQMDKDYWQRDICLGHKSMLPSLSPVQGGVRADSVTHLIFVVDFQYVPFLVSVPEKDVYTMGALEDTAGFLYRVRAPPIRCVIEATARLMRFTGDLGFAARALVQRELEAAVLGKKVSLRHLVFSFACPVEYFLALPVASSHMEWTGDDRLTLSSGKGFSVGAIGLVSRLWNMDGERAGKRGKAAERFPVVYNMVQDDQRPNPKPTFMSYSLETGRLTLGVSVAQFNAAFKHVRESAQLPAAPLQAPGAIRCMHKWSPHLEVWVPRSDPDASRAVARAAFLRRVWPWWG